MFCRPTKLRRATHVVRVGLVGLFGPRCRSNQGHLADGFRTDGIGKPPKANQPKYLSAPIVVAGNILHVVTRAASQPAARRKSKFLTVSPACTCTLGHWKKPAQPMGRRA